MIAVGHPRQRGQRLALGAGRDQQDAWGRQLLRELEVDEQAVGYVQQAEVAGDAHVANHGPADERHLPPAGHRRVEHLLHTVHVRREAGDDDPPGRLGDDVGDDPADVTLGRDEPAHLGVRGIGEQQVDTLVAEPREPVQVRDAPVQRGLVHLEVAGVQHGVAAYPDRHRQRVGDRVVDGEELQAPGADVGQFAFAYLAQVGVVEAMLVQLRGHQRQREA